MFPISHQICKLRDPLLWDTSTKLLHEREVSVTDKEEILACPFNQSQKHLRRITAWEMAQ